MLPGATGMAARDRLHGILSFAQRWKGRILFSFSDQGLVSATNFLLTVLYASWLPLDGFGRYVVVWTVALFIEAIQISLIVDSLPAAVSRYGRRSPRRIDAAAFWIVAVYSLATSLALAGAAAVLSATKPAYAGPLLILALINPLQRLYLFLRRLCYIRDRQAVAAAAALAYALASFVGLSALAAFDAISVGAVLWLLGLGSAAAVLTVLLGGVGRLSRIRPANAVWLALHIWSTGRWMTPAAIVSWLVNWGIFPLAAAISGPSVAGIIRALQNLLTPIVQFNAALNLAVLPRVADKVVDRGAPYARHFATRATAIFTAAVLAYCALILAAAPIILPAIYGKPEITASAFLLWPLALAIVCEAARAASSMSLLVTHRTRVIFLARLVSLAAFAGGAVALGPVMGFAGVLWGNALGAAAGGAIIIAAALRPARSGDVA